MIVKLINSSGISIVETLIALGLLVGVALTSSYIMTNTNVIRQNNEQKATVDQIHVLQVQRARSSDSIKAAAQLTTAQKTCFDGSRTGYDGINSPGTDDGCNVVGTSNIPQAWPGNLLEDFMNTDFSMFGGAEFIRSRASWKATCSADRCTSIDVRIITDECKPDGPDAGTECDDLAVSDVRKFEPRETILTFPRQFFADQVEIKFSCTIPGLIATSVSNSTNRATCAPFVTALETTCASAYPLRTFGDIITSVPINTCTDTPANTDCSGGANTGYRIINYLQKSCRTTH